MTQEQKAKRFDEVLAMAKECITYVPDEAVNKYILSIFPELKESEDERIKKELIAFIKKRDRSGCDYDYDKWLDWLEKQCDKDKLIKELGEYKVKYTQEVLEKCMSNKDDERLRKTTIDFLKEFADRGYENAVECIDWLEKQCYKPQGKTALEAINKEGADNQNCIKSVDELGQKFKVGDIVQYITDSTDIRKIEEIDTLCNMYYTDSSPIMFQVEDAWKVVVNAEDVEQEHTDKIEPKFHVGDWVLNDVCFPVQIASIECGMYVFTEGDALSSSFVDENYHLWTIQDAKDGDIIVCPKYAGDIVPNIFIFKGITVKDNDVICHCSFSKAFISTEHYIASADSINTDFYPATKEQRDTLFKAMTDAGYTFDFEKKVIKKRN